MKPEYYPFWAVAFAYPFVYLRHLSGGLIEGMHGAKATFELAHCMVVAIGIACLLIAMLFQKSLRFWIITNICLLISMTPLVCYNALQDVSMTFNEGRYNTTDKQIFAVCVYSLPFFFSFIFYQLIKEMKKP